MDRTKIKFLIEHWIEHNREHVNKYYELAEKLQKDLPEVSELISKAIRCFEEGDRYLEEASKKI